MCVCHDSSGAPLVVGDRSVLLTLCIIAGCLGYGVTECTTLPRSYEGETPCTRLGLGGKRIC